MQHRMRRAAATVILNLVLATGAHAADVRLASSHEGSPLPGITIEGRIAPGDFEKFAALALGTSGISTVWLASPGGNLSEAMRIGWLIRQLALEVQAPVDRIRPLVRLEDTGNNTCSSACFFMYAAGARRQGSVLGVHKPSLPADESFALGLEGLVAAQRRIQDATAIYLDRMGVPERYTAVMMATSSAGMLWLDPQDIDRDLTGVATEYVDRLRGTCPIQLAISGDGQGDCASLLLAELQQERRQHTIEHFRANR